MSVENFIPKTRKCPMCGENVLYRRYHTWWRANRENRRCGDCAEKCKVKTQFKKGHKNIANTLSARRKMSESQKMRYSNPRERENTSKSVKKAMHKPDVRRKHLDALGKSKYFGKTVDVDQVRIINKLNLLGFYFEINYQFRSDVNIYYIDGYDKIHNIILEIDSAYHKKPKQIEKDIIRQNIII